MKNKITGLTLVTALALIGLSIAANAYDSWIGTITSGGSSTTNYTTATPFNLQPGFPVAIQCDAAACVNVGQDAGTAASCAASAGGVTLAAGQLYDVPMVSVSSNPTLGVDTIAVISSSGTANCKVTKTITP